MVRFHGALHWVIRSHFWRFNVLFSFQFTLMSSHTNNKAWKEKWKESHSLRSEKENFNMLKATMKRYSREIHPMGENNGTLTNWDSLIRTPGIRQWMVCVCLCARCWIAHWKTLFLIIIRLELIFDSKSKKFLF